jgi:hypothetical protein
VFQFDGDIGNPVWWGAAGSQIGSGSSDRFSITEAETGTGLSKQGETKELIFSALLPSPKVVPLKSIDLLKSGHKT